MNPKPLPTNPPDAFPNPQCDGQESAPPTSLPAPADRAGNGPSSEANIVKIAPDLLVDQYAGGSLAPVSEDETKALIEPARAEDLDILPTGEVYLSHVHVRLRLNRVFGVGSWALRPLDKPAMQGKTMVWPMALCVRGHFMAAAYGEADYHENNDRQSYATAAESAKSNALTRCAKDLGIGWECWDRHRCQDFRKQHCIKVFCKSRETGKISAQWRRKSSTPFWNETGPCPDRDAGQIDTPIRQPQRSSQTATPAPAPAGKPAPPSAEELAEMDRRAAAEGSGQPDWNQPGWRPIFPVKFDAKPTKKGSTRFAIMFATNQGNVWASTFQEAIGATLRRVHAEGRQVWLRIVQKGDFYNIEEVYDGDRR